MPSYTPQRHSESHQALSSIPRGARNFPPALTGQEAQISSPLLTRTTPPAFVRLLLGLLGCATSVLPVVVHCDAPQTKDGNSAIAWARAKLHQVFNEVSEDLHRSEAALPFIEHQSKVETPSVHLQGDQICVKFAVRKGVDPAEVVQSLVFNLGDQVAYQRLTPPPHRSSSAQVLRFGASTSKAEMSAQLCLPATMEGQPQVEFYKQGALTDEDVGAIAAVLRSANTLVHEKRGPGWHTREWSSADGSSRFYSSSSSSSDRDESDFASGFPRGEQSFHGMFGDMAEQLDAMMRLMWGTEDAARDMLQRGAEHGKRLGRAWDQSGLPPLPGFGDPDAPLPEQTQPDQVRRRFSEDAVRSLEEQRQAPQETGSSHAYGSPAADRAVQKLESLGAKVYPPESQEVMDWGILAGYEEQKARIEDTLLLALKHPEVFDEVARGTRKHYASNCPRAILFEGPPGCGKTTSARVIASQASCPLVYVPLEAVASKWYGESEKNLSQMFAAVADLDGAIVFLDELDSLATTRSSEMHEATRRLLGVLLRQLDGFQTGERGRTVVLGATNRKQDLDPALRSRFDASITFGLPSRDCRQQILAQYAQHLKEADLAALADATGGMSGRDLRDVCESAERRWAAQIIRQQAERGSFPSADEYHKAAKQRAQDNKLAVPRMPLL